MIITALGQNNNKFTRDLNKKQTNTNKTINVLQNDFKKARKNLRTLEKNS